MKDTVERLVSDALAAAVSAGELDFGDTTELPDAGIERPRDAEHGDWASTIALRCAKQVGRNPREIAEIISIHIERSDDIERVEIAGPGFINMYLSATARGAIVADILTRGLAYGSSHVGAGQKVQVEFVSANPVGPMHVGHGRWAALGDSMARLLTATGHNVEREFYINDAGVQMDIFARSLSLRYLELCGGIIAMPEECYQGAYVRDLAEQIKEREGEAWVERPESERETHFRELGYEMVLEHMQKFLHDFGVDFDVWFSERTLYEGEPNAIERTLDVLQEGGYLYEHEGARWFRTTDFGDDKDRVLVKADGSYTYFAADIAYHKDKFDRGFERIINIWGADHHGYVARMLAAAAALGHEGALELVIGQLVNLFRDGVPVRMSKRTGEMVTFEELVDEVGADATRYWFLRRSTDQQVDFDLAVAAEQSADNPIYYVQYAHARICSLLRKCEHTRRRLSSSHCATIRAHDQKQVAPRQIGLHSCLHDASSTRNFGEEYTHTAETALIRKLSEFPDIVELAARDLAPHKLTHFAEELAAAFHHFYAHCRVIDEESVANEERLALCDATRITLHAAFNLIGIAAPERM